jgi:hypothetical protein
MLERSNVELLILAATFLKKLSIYKENKDVMASCGVVTKLVKFVPVRNEVLLMAVLRLLHNLSFDTTLREEMVKAGLIPKVSAGVATPVQRIPQAACMGQAPALHCCFSLAR